MFVQRFTMIWIVSTAYGDAPCIPYSLTDGQAPMFAERSANHNGCESHFIVHDKD